MMMNDDDNKNPSYEIEYVNEKQSLLETLQQQELHLAQLTETKTRIESNLAISSELELYTQQAEQASQQYVWQFAILNLFLLNLFLCLSLLVVWPFIPVMIVIK